MSAGVVANTTVSVLRGESVDGFMDDTDPPAVVYSNLVVSLLETLANSTRRRDSRPQTVRNFTIRFIDPTVDLFEDDRIRDEQTNQVYSIEQIVRLNNPVLGRSLRADLLKVS